MPKGLLIAFSNPLPGEEDAYNQWMGTHMQEALGVPGFLTAQRYRLAHEVPGFEAADNRYVAVYDLEGDFDEIVKEAGRRRRENEWVPRQGIDMSRVKEWIFVPISHTGEPQT
jgi:hypothetical protein